MRRARGSSISARRPSRAVALPVIGVHPSLGLSTWGHVGPPPRVARERPLAPGSHTRISPPHDSDHRAPSLPPRKSSHPLHPGRGQGHPQGGSSPEAPHEDSLQGFRHRGPPPHLRLPLQPAHLRAGHRRREPDHPVRRGHHVPQDQGDRGHRGVEDQDCGCGSRGWQGGGRHVRREGYQDGGVRSRRVRVPRARQGGRGGGARGGRGV